MDTEVDVFGNTIVCGFFYSDSLSVGDTTFYRSGTYLGFIVKLDSNNHATWAITGSNVIIYDCETDPSGNIYFTGYTSNHFNGINNGFPWRVYMFLFKYGPTGNQISATSSGGGGGANVHGFDLAVSSSGEVVVAGAYSAAAAGFSGWGNLNTPTGNDGFIVKYNSSFIATWAHGFYAPGDSRLRGVDFDLSGNVYSSGYYAGGTLTLNGQVYSNAGGVDGHLAKYNSSGIIQWVKPFEGSGNDYMLSVKVNNFGKAYFNGYYQSDTVRLDGSTYINSDQGGATNENLLGEISPTGSVNWTSNLTSTGADNFNEIVTYQDKGIYFSGSFNGAILTNGVDTVINSNPGFYDFSAGLFDFNGNLIWLRSGGGLANEFGRSINVYPNEDLVFDFRSNSPSYTVGTQTINAAGAFDMGTAILKNVPIETSTTVTDVTCGIGNDGAIDVQFTGGQAPYSISWDHGPSTAQISNLTPGNYRVTISDVNGCTTTENYSVQEQITLDPQVTVFSADTCGANNGMAIAVVTGGSQPYNFLWSTGSSSQIVSNLASGQYILTVTDANNCQVIRTVDIGGSSPPQLTTSATPTSTCGSTDGFAIVNISGQNSPFSILWSSGDTNSVASSLSKGWYTVTVTDSTGCSNFDSVLVDGPERPLISSTVMNPSCAGNTDGSIDLSLSGGVPPYSFIWGHGPTTQDVDSLAPGTYWVSITDSDFQNNNCITTDTFTILNPLPLGVNIDSTLPNCTQSNGSITAFGQGGTPPYKYLWSTGDTISTLFNVPSGQYWVRVKDSRQCELFRVIDLEDDVTFNTTLTTFNSDSCNQNTGVASVTMIGGQFPFNVQWSNGATGPFVNQLAAGNYSVSITDALGCADTLNFTIAGYNRPFINLTKNDPTICNGTDGALVLQISGQAGPYSVNWSSGDTSQFIFNASAGWYSVDVTDTNGCMATDSIQLNDPAKPRVSLTAQDQSCFNVQDGYIDLTLLSHQGHVTVKWSNGERTKDIAGLSSGIYKVSVYDSMSSITGCIGLDSIFVGSPPELIVTAISNNANCGMNNGSASINVNGGIPPYDFRWTNGAETLVIDSISSGIYMVEVEDVTGCKVDKQILISDDEAPSITASSITPISCSGGNNGAIDINVNGGTAPYSYWWTNGANTEDISNLSFGPYEVILIDDDSCLAIASFDISEPTPLSISSSTMNTNCGLATGSAQIHVEGGLAPYNFVWSNGGSDSIETGLSAGFYKVQVSDQSGCSDSIWVSVSENGGPDVFLDSLNLPICNQQTGSIFVSASGGGGPFNYVWSNGSNTEDLVSIPAGQYNLTVSNSQGCLGTLSQSLGGNPNFGDPICLVTVDSLTGSNLVVWEKNYFAGISHYNIYRESSSAGVYQQIGTVPFSQDGEFIDVTALPVFRSWRYKLSSVDTCGNESNLSEAHKTIHLTQNLGLIPNSINLSWDGYSGFSYATYFVYRNSFANGWELIDSLPSTLNSTTDIIPNLINDPWLYYVVTVQAPIGCDTDKRVGKSFKRSRSNDSNGGILGAVQSLNKENGFDEVKIFPNPFKDEVEIQGLNNISGTTLLTVYDLHGSKLETRHLLGTEKLLSFKELPAGVYFITLENGVSQSTFKLMKN